MNASTDSKITQKAIKVLTGLLVILCRMLYGSPAERFSTHLCGTCPSHPCAKATPSPSEPTICNSACCAQCSKPPAVHVCSQGKCSGSTQDDPSGCRRAVASLLCHPIPPETEVLSLLTKGGILRGNAEMHQEETLLDSCGLLT